jgi:hypothetical protein
MEGVLARLLFAPSPRSLRGRDERSSLLEGRGEGLSPQMLVLADRPVPPHPDRKGDPTSPRKRGEVKKAYRASIAAVIQRVIWLRASKSSAARRSSGASPLPCATATRRSQRRATAMPKAAWREPSDILRSYALIRPGISATRTTSPGASGAKCALNRSRSATRSTSSSSATPRSQLQKPILGRTYTSTSPPQAAAPQRNAFPAGQPSRGNGQAISCQSPFCSPCFGWSWRGAAC